jgi:hypothetical protein
MWNSGGFDYGGKECWDGVMVVTRGGEDEHDRLLPDVNAKAFIINCLRRILEKSVWQVTARQTVFGEFHHITR